MRVGMPRQLLKNDTRLRSANPGECIRAFALKLVEVSPANQARKWNCYGLGNGGDGDWIPQKSEFKDNILMAVVPFLYQ